jgi:hypothetical protein
LEAFPLTPFSLPACGGVVTCFGLLFRKLERFRVADDVVYQL